METRPGCFLMIVPVYAAWALLFVLLYAGGPLYVLGFSHSLIGAWAAVMFAHAVAFVAVAVSGRWGRFLAATVISFTVLNLWPAYLYYQWLPRGLVVRHLPPDVLPILHLAPLLFLALIAVGFITGRRSAEARG